MKEMRVQGICGRLPSSLWAFVPLCLTGKTMRKTWAAFVLCSVAWMSAGCTREQIAQWQRQHGQGVSPAATAQTLTPERTATSLADKQQPEAAPTDDTSQAVLAYVAQLETLAQGEQEPAASLTEQPVPSTGDPSRRGRGGEATWSTSAPDPSRQVGTDGAPRQPEPSTPRTNQPLNLAPPETGASTAELADRPVPPRILAVSVTTDDPLESDSPPVPWLGTNQGLDIAVPEHQESLRRLIEQAQLELAEDPGNVRQQWRLTLLQLAAGRPAEAAEFSPEITREQRSLMSAAVSSIEACGQLLTSPAPNEADALSTVNSLRSLLQDQADLTIPVVALCTKVSTFGVYDEYSTGALIPHRANRVIVYCEIENFRTQQDTAGYYRSSLSSRLELFAADGHSIWIQEDTGIEDKSRQRRDDFFLAQLVTLPPSLGPGEYVLKVTITDLLASNTNEAIHRFYVGTPPAD